VTQGRRWLAGCGLGCGILALLGIGACVVGALYLKHTFRGIEKANQSQDALIAELGGVDAYVPPSHGVPPPDRLELFVAVREEVKGERAQVEGAIAELPPPELTEDGAVVGKIRLGLEALGDLIDSMGTYLQARNRALLERRMSVGEYVYIYTLTYYSWLGHTPGEAPEIRQDPDGVRIGVFDEGSGIFNEQAVRRRYRRYILGMVREQLAASKQASAAGDGKVWRMALEAEIHRLEMDPGRVLWRDSLPPSIEVSLRPFRDRLEAAYSPSTNRIELPLAEHEVPWEWD
jgi:hypothetical protein